MAYSYERRRQLLAMDLPDSDDMRQRVREYLQRTGLMIPDLARRINYGVSSLHFWMQGRYHKVAGNDRNLVAAMKEFMDLNPAGGSEAREGKLYRTGSVKLIEKCFYKALDHGIAYYIYGPPGTQKTFTAERLIQELIHKEIAKNGKGRRAYYVYVRAGIRPGDLLRRMAEAAGTIMAGNSDRIIRNLRFDLRGRRSLFWLDEAQHLSNECLEVLRELLDRPPYCGFLFTGSHNLKQIFNQVEMEQWRRRLREGCSLPGLTGEEAEKIVRAELGDISRKRMDALIQGSMAADPRQGRDYTFISAKLFDAIREIRMEMAAKAATA